MELFAVDSINKLINVLIALSQKKRISNKRLCPCDCGTRLGKCSYHYHLNEYRNIMPRSRYASIINELKLSKT
jgi:hypothetical protein